MNLLGMILSVGYRFSRHFFWGVRMDILGVTAGLAGALALYGEVGPVWGILLAALVIASVALIFATQRTRYLLFRPQLGARPPLPSPTLDPNVKLSVRASGVFSVGDQVCHLTEHPAIFSTPRSGEHILMAHQQPSRLMLLGKSRSSNWGWWYQFLKPEAIEEIVPGTIIHGRRPRLALRVTYRVEDKAGNQDIARTALSFDDADSRALIWALMTQRMRKPTTISRLSAASRNAASSHGASDNGIPPAGPSPEPGTHPSRSCSTA